MLALLFIICVFMNYYFQVKRKNIVIVFLMLTHETVLMYRRIQYFFDKFHPLLLKKNIFIGGRSSVQWQREQWKYHFGNRPDFQNKVLQLTKEIKREDGSVKVVIDVDKLRYVFLNPEYKDHLVAVYAIAGPFRSGKSFLQNLLGSYLRRMEVSLSYMWTKFPLGRAIAYQNAQHLKISKDLLT